MALTLRRWLAIVVLACAAVAIWQIRPRDVATQPAAGFNGYAPRYGSPDAAARLAMANLRLRVLETRDSVFTASTTRRLPAGLTVLADHQVPDTVRQWLVSNLRAAWAKYETAGEVPVVVGIVEDTTSTNDGLPMARRGSMQAYTFPPDSAMHVCRVLMRIQVDLRGVAHGGMRLEQRVSQSIRSRATARAALGPCALFAVFGTPGEAVGRWLTRAQWAPAAEIDWTHESPKWTDTYDEAIWQPPFALFGGRPAWDRRYWFSNDAIACMAGSTDRCTAALLGRAERPGDDQAWKSRVIDAEYLGERWWAGAGRRAGFGPDQGWILSEMVRQLGRDRFETFWKSPLPLDSAFQAAAQQPLGTWLETWARRSYGADVLGPWVPVRARWTGLLVVLLGLGVAMVFARERRVI